MHASWLGSHHASKLGCTLGMQWGAILLPSPDGGVSEQSWLGLAGAIARRCGVGSRLGGVFWRLLWFDRFRVKGKGQGRTVLVGVSFAVGVDSEFAAEVNESSAVGVVAMDQDIFASGNQVVEIVAGSNNGRESGGNLVFSLWWQTGGKCRVRAGKGGSGVVWTKFEGVTDEVVAVVGLEIDEGEQFGQGLDTRLVIGFSEGNGVLEDWECCGFCHGQYVGLVGTEGKRERGEESGPMMVA